MSILNTGVGEALSPLVKPAITQGQLRRYADASGDHNPIHLDEEVARRVGLGGVIAHGMLSMAFLGQFLEQQIAGIPGAFIAQINVRFVNMVRLGDTITCEGVVQERTGDDDREVITVECWAQNQRGEKVTIGKGVLSLPLVRDSSEVQA
ncbi:MAG TPA: MaoC/PaaZ C-terminal domain-containing protein [Ktedonobacteraceae bacterium]|nr:MaoC/PaaZ C-terminal domain-containing protein [Ktedonobacteraceae bacterium]